MQLPSWAKYLLKAASIFGIPILKMLFPSVGQDVWKLIEDIINHVDAADDKPAAVREIKEAVGRCTGSFCPAGTKGLD